MMDKDIILDDLLKEFKESGKMLWAAFIQEKLISLMGCERLCKTCRYWEKYDQSIFKEQLRGKCYKMSANLNFELPIETPESFGCVHWEAKL